MRMSGCKLRSISPTFMLRWESDRDIADDRLEMIDIVQLLFDLPRLSEPGSRDERI